MARPDTTAANVPGERGDGSRSPGSRRTLALAGGIACLVVALHVACGNRYGVFRDELYFLACGRHLAWGYVDQPPLVAVVAWVSAAVFGTSPLGLRVLPFLAHALTVVLAGALASRLGGRRYAVALAAVATAASPVLLGLGHLLTMNAFDPPLWTGLALLALAAVEGGGALAWIGVGFLVGVGLLNKYAMAFWAAALLAGILLTPRRRALATRWLPVAAIVAIVLFLPNLAWQARHGFPMVELLRNGQLYKNAPFSIGAFASGALLEQNPAAAPLWMAGLLWLLADARRRWLGLAFVLVAAELIVLRGKPYYLAPAFPVLLASGGCAAEWLLRAVTWRAVALVGPTAIGLLLAPMALPLLPAPSFLRWQAALGLRENPTERLERGALPQVFADEHGWRELVAAVGRAWNAVPAEVRAHGIVVAANYGEAGAIDLYGAQHGLPGAYSGHNNYWLWGPPPADTTAAMVIGGRGDDYRGSWQVVEQVGETPDSAWNMPYERRRPIWLLRHPKRPIAELWRGARLYI